MPARRKLTDEMLELAGTLLAAGESLRTAAAALELTESTLWYHGLRRDPEHTRQQRAEFARGLRKRWSRDRILAAVAAWVELYGAPPAAADWNPAMARRQGRPDRAERHAAGDWPFASTVSRYFGSWSAAIEAAGWRSRPRGDWRPPAATAEDERRRAEVLAEVNAGVPVDEQIVAVCGEDGQDRPGAYARRRGHRLRDAP